MAVQKKFALGRGLDALISNDEVKTSGSSSINEIELSKISVNPNQPRREFDPIALQERRNRDYPTDYPAADERRLLSDYCR